MEKNYRILEADLRNDASIVIKQNHDGTAEFIVTIHDDKKYQEIASESKKLNLSPSGYLKLIILSFLGRDEVMKIFDEYGLK